MWQRSVGTVRRRLMSTAATFAALTESLSTVTVTCAVAAQRTVHRRLSGLCVVSSELAHVPGACRGAQRRYRAQVTLSTAVGLLLIRYQHTSQRLTVAGA